MRWFCAISRFEIALKHRQGKLELPLTPLRWLRGVEARYALTELPVDSALCVAATELPHHHSDPFDRFIIAQAIREGATVVSADRWFRAYGLPVIW